MKTLMTLFLTVFFGLPPAVGAALVLATLWIFGYINASWGNSQLLASANLLGQLYAGTTPTYTSPQQQDFVTSWKAYLDALLPRLNTDYGVAVPANYIGPFLQAADAKLNAWYPPATP